MMERLTKWLNEKKTLCIEVCEKKCVNGYDVCHKCEPFKDVVKKLAEYEDAEEQGLLLRLPCKVGDNAYTITRPYNLDIDGKDELDVFDCVVESIAFYKNGICRVQLYNKSKFLGWHVRLVDFGKTVFLTKEEAEQALAEMKTN